MSTPTRESDDLITWLRDHEAACPVCEYSLKGLETETCPECGATLHLTVGTRDLALGPWIVALISSSLGLGFDGVTVLIMIYAVTLGPAGSPAARFYVALAGLILLGIACALGTAALVVRRRSWLRMARSRQRWFAAAVFTAVGLVHAAFGALILA